MRILLISDVFPPGFVGGYELGALDVTRALLARGHTLRVLTSDYFGDDTRKLAGIDVVRSLECVYPGRMAVAPIELARRTWFVDPRTVKRVASELIAFRPECVLAYNLMGIGPIGLLRFLVSIGMVPVLHLMDDMFHGGRSVPQARAKARQIFGGTEFLDRVEVIAMSDRVRLEVEETLGHRLRNVTLVPGWPDPNLPRAPLVQAEADLDAGVRFVFTSRVAPHKGIDLIVQAVRTLVDAGYRNFWVDVYGAGETAWLAQQVAAHGLGNEIRYRGVLPKIEMTRRLADYDALLFPTAEREPFGFVVAEAAAAGCIPVLTGTIGAAEWFFDGIDCLKIRRNTADLTAAMFELLLMPACGRLQMRHRASDAAHRFLDFDRALPRIEAVAERAAARSAPVDPALVRACEAAMTVLDDMWRPTELA